MSQLRDMIDDGIARELGFRRGEYDFLLDWDMSQDERHRQIAGIADTISLTHTQSRYEQLVSYEVVEKRPGIFTIKVLYKEIP